MLDMLKKLYNHEDLTAADIDLIVDALEYSATQTRSSGGDIQVWFKAITVSNEDSLLIAKAAMSVADKLKEMTLDNKDRFVILVEG